MATVAPSFRYSTETIATSEAAKAFSWEAPVPVNEFWNSFNYPIARNFLANFSDTELAALPLDSRGSNDDHQAKLRLLLRLLEEKLDREEAAASSPPQTLYTKDYKRWYQLWQGIYLLQNELNLPSAELTVRMLVEKNPDRSNIVPAYMLAEHLVKIGANREAEETARQVCEWLDKQSGLGPDSPQAIHCRRIIAQALWNQGPSRLSEAEAQLTEIDQLIDGMKGGKFDVYQSEERKLTEAMRIDIGI